MSGEEKRQFPRADLVFDLKIKSSQENGETSAAGRDISSSGVSFALEGDDLKIGQIVAVTFSISGLPGEINAQGRVVRVWESEGKHYSALEFTRIDSSDHEIIQDLIEAYLKENNEG